jgi:hypothetical protein
MNINIIPTPEPSDVTLDVHVTNEICVFSKTAKKTLARFSPRWQKHASQSPKMHVHFMWDTFGYMVLAQCVLPAPRYHPQMFSENQRLRCPNCPRPTLTLKFQNSTLLAR